MGRGDKMSCVQRMGLMASSGEGKRICGRQQLRNSQAVFLALREAAAAPQKFGIGSLFAQFVGRHVTPSSSKRAHSLAGRTKSVHVWVARVRKFLSEFQH